MSWQKKTEQSTNICRWWNAGCQHDSLGLGSTAVQQSLIADLGFKSNLPEKWSCNFCCGRLSQKPSLERNELKAREEGGGGRQEFICLNNKISTTGGMQFVRGHNGAGKMPYSGLTCYHHSFRQVRLLNISSVCAIKKASSTCDSAPATTWQLQPWDLETWV